MVRRNTRPDCKELYVSTSGEKRMIAVTPVTTKAALLRARKILGLYNDHGRFNETLTVADPERLFIAYPLDCPGGIIVNHYTDFGKEAVILYAAFAEADRGKGLLKSCIGAMEKALGKRKPKGSIVGVGLSGFEPDDIWRHLGFTHKGFLNFQPHLFDRPMEELFEGARESTAVSDLMALQERPKSPGVREYSGLR